MSLNQRIVFFAARATLLAVAAHGPPPLPGHLDFSAGSPASGETAAPAVLPSGLTELRLAMGATMPANGA
jgi:hypothetical protein